MILVDITNKCIRLKFHAGCTGNKVLLDITPEAFPWGVLKQSKMIYDPAEIEIEMCAYRAYLSFAYNSI